MERMTMQTAGQVARAAVARLTDLAADLVAGVLGLAPWAAPSMVPATNPSRVRTSVRVTTGYGHGVVKLATTGGFCTIDHASRRQPERCP